MQNCQNAQVLSIAIIKKNDIFHDETLTENSSLKFCISAVISPTKFMIINIAAYCIGSAKSNIVLEDILAFIGKVRDNFTLLLNPYKSYINIKYIYTHSWVVQWICQRLQLEFSNETVAIALINAQQISNKEKPNLPHEGLYFPVSKISWRQQHQMPHQFVPES